MAAQHQQTAPVGAARGWREESRWRGSCAWRPSVADGRSPTTTSCGAGRSPSSRVLGGGLGLLRRARVARPTSEVLDSHRMPGTRWFAGAELNYAENLLLGRAGAAPRRDVAVLHASELRELGRLSWGEFGEQVARVAGGLRALGVGRGDRVVAYMPNIPETLSRCSPSRASARSGRARRRSSARAAWSTASRRSSRR